MLIEEMLLSEKATVKEAMKKLNQTAKKVLFIVNELNALQGSLSDGDIRRHLLSDGDLDDDLIGVYNRDPIFVKQRDFSIEKAKGTLLEKKIDLIPIVDEDMKVIDFVSWAKAFGEKPEISCEPVLLNIPVVIMAGGKGNRLEPFTTVFPKPLIPIGENTIIEVILDRFKRKGIEKFYITLNYKNEMVKAYFKTLKGKYNIEFIFEDEFLGTAGSLKLLERKIADTFIVSNCDIILDVNYAEVLSFHNERNSKFTVVSAMKHFQIPYGIVDFENGGMVTRISEKPEYTFAANTGFYVLSRDCLGLIPEKRSFDMTDLIKRLLEDGAKILTFPVNESRYVDIGQWDLFKSASDKLKLIGLLQPTRV